MITYEMAVESAKRVIQEQVSRHGEGFFDVSATFGACDYRHCLIGYILRDLGHETPESNHGVRLLPRFTAIQMDDHAVDFLEHLQVLQDCGERWAEIHRLIEEDYHVDSAVEYDAASV